MIEAFAIIQVPTAPMREEGRHSSQMVSQLLFGEKCIVFEKRKDGWLFIRSEWDHYDGWIHEGAVRFISEREYKRPNKFINTSRQDLLVNEHKEILLSPGSSLFRLVGRQFKWEKEFPYYFKGKKRDISQIKFDPELLLDYCQSFMGAPYLWGGRSIMGIDCSGFSQVIYKCFNIRIPRDASLQAKEGEEIHFLQDAKIGDLAFFDNEEGRINHVGILLNNETIIHATDSVGQVVIDKIDYGGIVSTQLRKRTHNLRLIRRFV